MKDNKIATNYTINCQGKLIDFSTTRIMGILNVTPDSFYSESQITNEKQLLQTAETHLNGGATILDIGGYSTQPGASDVSEDEEYKRVIPMIESLRKNFSQAFISVDTFRSAIAKEAIYSGANIINDVSGGNLDPKMFETVALLKAPYILMHSRGNPKTMQTMTNYQNITQDVILDLSQKVTTLTELGVHDIIIDPGFGFAKNIDQNFELLQNIKRFKLLNKPILVGISRKSMIHKELNIKNEQALSGTTALNTFSLLNQAQLLRVHDVKEAEETIHLMSKLNQ